MELLSIGSQLSAMQREFEKLKEKYEKFKCDVSIKLKFLDENQVGCLPLSFRLATDLFSLFLVFVDESDEEAIAPFSQCHRRLLLWQSAGARCDNETVQP
jgi:hypothetical protein